MFNRNICTIIRKRITFQFDRDNVGLLTTRRVTRLPFDNVFISNLYTEYKVASHDRNTIIFPLWIYEDAKSKDRGFFGDKRRSNLNPAFLHALASQLHVLQKTPHDLPSDLTAEDIFGYIYAVFYSPSYRSRYAEFLKIDFPRVLLPSSLDLFRELARLGGELVALHLLESPALDTPRTEFVGNNRQVRKIGWTPDNGGTVWIDGIGSRANFKPGASGFRSVPEEVWNFHIGGYQVCEKWLKDRGPKSGNPGRILTDEDIAHYQKIVIALTETIRLMAEIDKLIESHGGWPDAFVTSDETED